MYGNRMENGYEDGMDAMSETLQERLKLGKHEAKQLVQDLVKARTIRYEGNSGSLPASANQATEVPLVDGFWYL
jgi:hypothetical protein